MKQKWNYQHYIDLEYLFHRDVNISPTRLHKRDRDIFIKSGTELPGNPPADHELTDLWIRERIRHEFPGQENKSPGAIFRDGLSVLKVVCVIIGIFLGVGAGLSFFTYSGSTPVNVFHFLIIFVFSQIGLTLLLASSLIFRRLTGSVSVPPFYSLFFGKLLKKVITMIGSQWNRTLSAEKRDSINQAMGLARSHGRRYGSLFYWPLFTLSQLLAFFFNGGLLAATLFKISTSDLAFGWQSTLQFGAASLHRLIEIIALPWSWFIPDTIAYPSLAEVEGSRIILKEGIYHLTTENLVSWWPFLVFCLLFYGLFFRGMSYLAGKWMERRSLQKITLHSAPCRRLIQRMLNPLISTQARPELQKTKSISSVDSKRIRQPTGNLTYPQFVLIPDDIFDNLPVEKFKQILHGQGFSIEETIRFMAGYDSDQKIIEHLQQQSWKDTTGILLLMEGWMVPLIDFLTYLQELRSATTAETIITVVLVGRPAKTPFTAVSQTDYTIWQKKIEALGDPGLSIFPLIPDEGETDIP